MTTNWLAAAGLITMSPEVAVTRFPLEKVMVIVPAVLSPRPVNVATPPTTVAVAVSRSVPAPLLMVAVTTVLLSLVSRLPY